MPNSKIDHQPVDATEVTGIASSLSVELAKHRRASKTLQFDFISRGKVQQIKCRCILFSFFLGWLDSFWRYRVLVYSMTSKALQLLGVLSFSELRLAMPVNSKNSNATKLTWEFELEEARVGSSPHCQTSISICQLHPPRKTSSPHLKMYASKRKFRTWKPWFLRSKC